MIFPKSSLKLDGGKRSLLIRSSVSVTGSGNSMVIGDDCTLRHTVFKFAGSNNKIVIGNGVKFYEKAGIFFEGDNCVLIIDDNSTFGSCEFHFGESNTQITIGKDCMFSRDIVMGTSDYHSIIDMLTNKRINPPENIVIDNHVWVGNGVHVNKGSHVGSNCVIASKAVVVKKLIGNNLLFGGIPGRIIKENITWSREQL